MIKKKKETLAHLKNYLLYTLINKILGKLLLVNLKLQ